LSRATRTSLWDLLGKWLFWVELLITAVCGIYWAVQMNRSLGLYDPLFIIPLLQSSYITFGATASGIFYQEFRTLHEKGLAGPGSWVFFIGGMIMIVAGIMLLAPTATDAPIPRNSVTYPPNSNRKESTGSLHSNEHVRAALNPTNNVACSGKQLTAIESSKNYGSMLDEESSVEMAPSGVGDWANKASGGLGKERL